MPSPQSEFGLSVDEFAKALRDAVHDVKHEQTPGQGLRHFWDFSCLYPLLSAHNLRQTYKDFPRLGAPEQRRELLTLALFSAGMTGSISLLPPHIAEFYNEVEHELQHGERYQEELTRSWLIGSLNDLDKFYHHLQRAVPEDVADVLAQFDVEQAIAAQLLASPSTARRVRSWIQYRQLDISAPNLKPDFHAAGGIFAEVLSALSRERPNPATRGANLADSVAINMLSDLNGRKEFPYPRFFSSSPALNRVLRRTIVAENFNYDCTDAYGYEFTSSIVRETTYYYVRSIFPALNWKSVDHDHTAPRITTDLEELADLSANLNQALSASQPGIVDKIYFQGKPIGELLLQMRTAGSKASLINVPTDRFAQHLIGLNTQETAVSEAERTRLTMDLRRRLRFAADRAKQDAATAAATVSACTLVAERVKDLARNHDPIEKLDALSFVQAELFAYRWAYSTVDPEYAGALYDTAFPGQSNEPTNLASRIIAFATPNVVRDPGPERWQWLATLYSVDLFDLVIESANDGAPPAHTDTVSALIVLAAGCRVSEQRRNSDALTVHREAIRDLWADSALDERDELVLGFGSALLHSRLNWQAALGSTDDLFDWPECREIGEYAVSRAQSLADRPMYRFVVNFICVLNLYGQVSDSRARPFWPILETFASEKAEGNYRMTDTLALRRFVGARRALESNHTDAAALEILASTRSDLRRLLQRRHSNVVSEHYELVNDIHRLYNGGARNG